MKWVFLFMEQMLPACQGRSWACGCMTATHCILPTVHRLTIALPRNHLFRGIELGQAGDGVMPGDVSVRAVSLVRVEVMRASPQTCRASMEVGVYSKMVGGAALPLGALNQQQQADRHHLTPPQ